MYCLAATATTSYCQNSSNDYLFFQKTASSEYVHEKYVKKYVRLCGTTGWAISQAAEAGNPWTKETGTKHT